MNSLCLRKPKGSVLLICMGPIHRHSLSPLIPFVIDRAKKPTLEVIISHIIMLGTICMYWPLEMLWVLTPMNIFPC